MRSTNPSSAHPDKYSRSSRLSGRLVELGLAHVGMVAVAEPLEDGGRYEPAEGPDDCTEPLRATHLPKRLEDARRAVVGEEDRVPARLERATRRRQERRRIRV